MSFWPEGQLSPERTYTAAELAAAAAGGQILWARACRFDAQRRLHFALGCCEGIMPFEECALGAAEGAVRDIAVITRVGRLTCFVVQELRTTPEGTQVALLSRAAAQRRCREQYFDRLQPGDIIPAHVTSVEGFGAFCDVGCGLIALLPIDYLSVSRIRSPRQRVSPGQDIYCVVKKRDEQGRLVLSMKELLGTWEENVARFHVGETVIGRVRGIETYGVFVEIAPNLAGLAEVRGDLELDDCVSVYIKSILPQRMKIKLVILGKLEGRLPAPELTFLRTEGHIDRWDYAPALSQRRMESIFDA